MAYSNRLLKGVVGYNEAGWPSIVMERAKSDKPSTPVLCEVYGPFHECGSMYYNEFKPAMNMEDWEEAVEESGDDGLEDRYFKGELILAKED